MLLLWSCGGPTASKSGGMAKRDSVSVPADYDFRKLEGIYSGDFGGSDIHVSLRHVNGKHAMGYSIHKGLKRNFYGNMRQEANGFSFKLNEPGNNPYDGTFDFVLDTATMTIKGSWKPNDAQKAQAKTYQLTMLIDSLKEYMPVIGDSIGSFTFEDDGRCTYETFEQEELKIPSVIVNGNWTKHGDDFTIDWEPNSVFASRRSVLKQVVQQRAGRDGESSYNETYYTVDGRKLGNEY